MKPVLHITWEYPPFVVGALSQELRGIISPLAKDVPLVLVVRAGQDGNSEQDGIRVYLVAQSIANSPHVLAFCHTMNIDLLRGACRAIYDSRGASVVHCHDWISALAGIYLKSNFGLPFVVSVYSTERSRNPAMNSLLSMGIFDIERHCFGYADSLVVPDSSLRADLTSGYGVDPSKIFEGELIDLYRKLGGPV